MAWGVLPTAVREGVSMFGMRRVVCRQLRTGADGARAHGACMAAAHPHAAHRGGRAGHVVLCAGAHPRQHLGRHGRLRAVQVRPVHYSTTFMAELFYLTSKK